MHHVQRTIVAGQLLGLRSGRTVRQLRPRYAGQPLEVIVARVAEVRRAEAEEHGDGAAVAALVLQKVGAVLGAHLGTGDVRAAAADQLLGVEFVAGLGVAARLAAVVGLVALEADVVGVPVHGVGGRRRRRGAGIRRGDGLVAFVLEPAGV